MQAPVPQQGQDGPLSLEQMQLVVAADRQQASFVFAAKVASFNGWSLVAGAGLCLPFAVFSPWSLLVAVALAAFAYFELQGRSRLRALDPGGAKALAVNQLALLLGVYVYCGINVYLTFSGPPLAEQLQQDASVAAALEASGDPMLRDMVGDMDGLVQAVSLTVYAAMAGLSTLFQGGMAMYYLGKRRAMMAYLEVTPSWILALQRHRR